jgi:putative transposase
LAEVADHFEGHPHQVREWKRQLLERAGVVFESVRRKDDPPVDLKALHAKIGQLTLENDFFRRRAHQGGIAERKAMIDPKHELSITRQAQVLGISLGGGVFTCLPIAFEQGVWPGRKTAGAS